MTGQQADIQWYIAREGKQHGPLSDAEMRTFVAQGHLKPTDLIWRAGFADWRPAPAVFPFPQPDAAPPPPPAAPAAPAARWPESGPSQHAQNYGGAGGHQGGMGESYGGDSQPSFDPERIRTTDGFDEGRGSNLRRIVGALTLIALLGGGGWYFWQSGAVSSLQDSISSADGEVPTVHAPDASTSDTPLSAQNAAPAAELNASAQELDAKIGQLAAWVVVKREFPDWYAQKLNEAANLKAENKTEAEIDQFFAESLVALRREHANDALASSTPHLKQVATAFLQNLKALSEKSMDACYSFISQGETSAAVLEVLQSPEAGAPVQAQVASIFEAIADGRRSPTAHDKAVKEDYDVLVQELTKLGWQPNDLQVFSNPSLLGKEPPQRVCQMVQDWFLAHLSVPDASVQERLLVETLKPVVSG
ncbi:hypothetical protein APY04_1311 [Hyphomicrobium sulfonivorans]|uniref:GYF domain-containing protein n=1 Tax=Hyphomicrobium sulfonivorans TaxID=121290 RepID=A0A109BJH9_HYPSL|nr:DUF4339 domain-containing protein [Hyphomicrobium sulfonivorans]KWT69811.1 hypothetical protein APY04_1311 [Hyphomicrobium sulfonivorans]